MRAGATSAAGSRERESVRLDWEANSSRLRRFARRASSTRRSARSRRWRVRATVLGGGFDWGWEGLEMGVGGGGGEFISE